MNRVYLGVGSNVERERHITAALDALTDAFGELLISSVYESEAVGFDGDHFLNLVVGCDTDLSVGNLSACLRKIENDNGRARGGERFSARTLDIDILTYGNTVGTVDSIHLPRAEILQNAFVLLPLAEIAGAEKHPVEQKTYADLWRAYSRSQKLWPIDFLWCSQLISRRQVP